MNEENIVLHGVAVESSLIDSTLLSILRHSLYQQINRATGATGSTILI
ncbi:hypothetical protein [Bacillus sp. N6]